MADLVRDVFLAGFPAGVFSGPTQHCSVWPDGLGAGGLCLLLCLEIFLG